MPPELFKTGQKPDIYIKYIAAQIIKELTPASVNEIQDTLLAKEICAIKAIQPHALITTNYDELLELIFPDYKPVIGQSILRGDYATIGEIFKIHGCVTDPNSLVLNRSDYDEFKKKKKYISAKLLAYLSEHPVLFVGYSVSDPNVQSILADIDEILSPDGALISNIYFLERNEQFDPDGRYPAEKLIQVGEHRSIRVKSISANDFNWVFKAFSVKSSLEKVNIKLLRSLLARTYELVRVDIPQQRVEVNYSMLTEALEESEGLSKLLGITRLDQSGNINITHPHTLTDIGKMLGYPIWNKANELIESVKRRTGKDIKGSDNKYHCNVKYGQSYCRKYSNEIIPLLKKVKNNESYDDDIKDLT